MRNWNDAGTVHFDQETSEMPVRCVVAGKVHGVEVRIEVLVPHRIKRVLKSEHWDQAEKVIEREYVGCMNKAMKAQVPAHMLKLATETGVRIAICEHLYQQFTLEQANLGNQVWATPPTMQRIGPKPEDDVKLLN